MHAKGRYQGKNVVIVGGTSGIGLATARLFVSEGARVLIAGRTQQTLDAASESLGGDVTVVRADMSVMSDIAVLVAGAQAALTTVDALVVNAGVNGFAAFEEMTEELYDQMFFVNARGPYFTVQKLLPLMAAGSSVVFTTSISNVMGHATVSAYSASKAALRSMTRSLARELSPREIRVNAVSPGPINSGILEKSMPSGAAEQLLTQFAEHNPMLRVGNPEEVAKAVAFMAFDATYTTGAEIPVDGGASQL